MKGSRLFRHKIFLVWAALIVILEDSLFDVLENPTGRPQKCDPDPRVMENDSQCWRIIADAANINIPSGHCQNLSSSCDYLFRCRMAESEDEDFPISNCTENNIIIAASIRDIDNHWVGLNVSWISKILDESTKFDVIVEEKVGLLSEEYTVVYENTLEGNNTSNVEQSNLLADWGYRVSVRVRTDSTNCTWCAQVEARTLTNAPGVVRNLMVIQDEIFATKIMINFECPLEKHRNGTIVQYNVRKTWIESDVFFEEHYNIPVNTSTTDMSCYYNISQEDVGAVVVEQNYTFEVRAVNQDYSANISASTSIYIEPRTPVLTKSGSTRLLSATTPAGLTPGGSTIDVIVCTTCLTDSSQGKVTTLGLIVNVVTANRSCSPCEGNFSSYDTWAKAARLNFSIQYRATPDDWFHDLLNSSDTVTFTLGSDAGCDVNNDTLYCNGPLPTYKDITISVYKCNLAGCACLTYEGEFTTRAKNVPPFNTVGLGIGIGMASAVVLTAITMGVVACITEKKAQKDIQDITHRRSSKIMSSQIEDQGNITLERYQKTSDNTDTENFPRRSDFGEKTGSSGGNKIITDSSRGRKASSSSVHGDEIEIISQEVTVLPDMESVRLREIIRQGSRRVSLTNLM